MAIAGRRDNPTARVRRERRKLFDDEFLLRLERLHLLAKRLAFRGSAGTRRSRRLGDGLEFADHRDYAPGDDIRFIDWPYYARMEKLLLRLFHEHSEADVVILLDASGSMAPGGAPAKFHYALRTAAALAYVAMGSLDRVILLPFAEDLGEPLRTGRSRMGIFPVLDFLAALGAGGQTRLRRCVERMIRRYDRPGTVLLISDLLDCQDELSDALARLKQSGGDVWALHLYAPADARPELDGPVLLRQAETGRQISLHVHEQLLASYRQRWEEFRAGCERTCLSRGATYVSAATDVPFEQLVLGTLRRAGVLAG